MAYFPRCTLVLPALLLLIAACSPGAVLLDTESTQRPDSTQRDTTSVDTTTADTTVVQRAALALTVRVFGKDSVVAAAAGMSDGVLEGADVTIQRAGASNTQSVSTDSGGTAHFAELLPGSYSVSALRILTAAERAQLTGPDTAVNAFGGGATVEVKPLETVAEVRVRRSGRGSLIVSEMFPARWLGSEAYPFGTYIELYNNTDSTIYLAGKLFGAGPFFWWDQSPNGISCAQGEPIQNDSIGLWATSIWRFPGSGRQHALPPGRTAVLATDAIDHSIVDARWPDLSGADFEFKGSADVDNPAVPNMIRAAPPVFDDVLGHGERFTSLGIPWYVAESMDVASLLTANPYGNRPPLRRIPRESVLDVFMSTVRLSDLASLGVQLCPVLINDVFDQGPAHFFMAAEFYSIQRAVLATQPNGLALLLRTRSTRIDFFVSAGPSPGRVP